MYIVLNTLEYTATYIVIFIVLYTVLGFLHIRVLRAVCSAVFSTLYTIVFNTKYMRREGNWSAENKPVWSFTLMFV